LKVPESVVCVTGSYIDRTVAISVRLIGYWT